MNYRIMFVINAVALLLAGIFFLILPQTALGLFGTEVYVSTLFVARILGGSLFLAGLFLWFLKEAFDEKTQRNLGMVLLGGAVGGFVMTLIGMGALGVIRTNGWVLLVIFGLFTLIYGFLIFLMPQMMSAGSGNTYRKQV